MSMLEKSEDLSKFFDKNLLRIRQLSTIPEGANSNAVTVAANIVRSQLCGSNN